ncbi:maleylacetoacetate isomerase [Aerophototrophica crusticola]|uniref:Maleylacetoacetate isomerase n=1 Tax=Aerophototrophica crusticola TaxID=1709002 RepID=A0A858RBB8_9PROT|nr:maleylacetoacetate isomerase [Rhodospirillaceae bacterium B3]
MRLYTYFRSSAAYRVRIGLALKGLDAEAVPVHLVRDGGQHKKPDYLGRNPQGFVPALEVGGQVITQSLAILEYLEEAHPQPPLLPKDPLARARVRSFALAIACDIHPLNNLRVLKHLRGGLGQDEDGVNRWVRRWIEEGFTALERMVEPGAPFCFGDAPGLAEACLVPQMYNARRFGADLTDFPTLVAIDERCRALPTFQSAAPDRQPDAE